MTSRDDRGGSQQTLPASSTPAGADEASPDERDAPPRRYRRLAIASAAVVLGVMGLVGVAQVISADRRMTPHPPAPLSSSGQEALVDARTTPSLARDPTRPDHLAVTLRVDQPSFDAELYTSTDGGTDWRRAELPLPRGVDRPYAPDVAYGPDGTLYVLYSHLEGNGNVPAALWMVRSVDGGRAFQDPVQVAEGLAFQPRLTVGDDETVHVTYLEATDVTVLSFAGPVRVVATRSTDGGRTFSDPVAVSSSGRERVGAAVPVTHGDDVVVVFIDYRDNRRDFQNLEGPPWGQPSELVASRSTDGGRTFDEKVTIDDQLLAGRRFLAFLPEYPSVAADSDGALTVVWADARNGDEDVFSSRSRDTGRSWTSPVRVNDNPRHDGTSQYLPAVDVAEGGRIDVVYLDRRRDPADDTLTHVAVATSTDDGRTFSSVRVSPKAFDGRRGPELPLAPQVEPSLGSRLGVASVDEHALTVWTHTLFDDDDVGRQDVAAVRVDMPETEAIWRGWGLVALATLALPVLGVAALRTRRSRPVQLSTNERG